MNDLTNAERLIALKDIAAWLVDQMFISDPTLTNELENMLSGVHAPPVSWTNAELISFVAQHKIPYKYHESDYYDRVKL